MNTDAGRKLDAIARVLAHCEAHPDESTGFTAVLERLKVGVHRAEVLATQQLDGALNVRAATARKKDLRAQVHHHYLVPLVRMAGSAAGEEPGLAQVFRLPRIAGKFTVWRIAARRLAAEAERRKELLAKHGMTESLLAGLVAALDEFDAALDRGANGRSAHVGATADLEEVMRVNMDLVDVLDGINLYRFRDDPEQLAAWVSARSLFGPVTAKEVPPPAGGPTQSAA